MKVHREAKNKRSLDRKIELIMSAIKDDFRRVKAIEGMQGKGSYGKLYTMAEIAKLSGYSRSSKFMLTLYEMVDRKLLVKQEYNSRTGKAITPVNIYFMLPETERMYRQADFLPREYAR